MAKVVKLRKETLHSLRMSPPAHLNAPARQHWAELLESLAAGHGLTREDVDLLAVYCDFYARWVKARESIDAMGLVVKSSDGKPIANPFIAIADQCATQMRFLLGEMALTPAARRRLKMQRDLQVSSDEISNIKVPVPHDHSRR